MKKKTNNLNYVLEDIVNQYFGDFSLEENKKEKIEQKPIVEITEQKQKSEKAENKDENKNEEIDPNVFLESLREDFFIMLNTTKRIEEKKEISNQLEDIAKTFFK
jgi:hypothetical protein